MDVNDDDFCVGFFASIMVLFEAYLVYMRKIKEHKPKSLLSKRSLKIPEHYKYWHSHIRQEDTENLWNLEFGGALEWATERVRNIIQVFARYARIKSLLSWGFVCLCSASIENFSFLFAVCCNALNIWCCRKSSRMRIWRHWDQCNTLYARFPCRFILIK